MQEALRHRQTPSLYFHLAQAQWAAKQRPQALESLKRAQSLNLQVKLLHPRERQALKTMVAAD